MKLLASSQVKPANVTRNQKLYLPPCERWTILITAATITHQMKKVKCLSQRTRLKK